MVKTIVYAESLASKRSSLVLHPDDFIGKSEFLNPKSHSGAAAVVEDGHLIGILTERDLLKSVLGKGLDPHKTRVREVMTHNPAFIYAESTLKEALNVIVDSGFRYLPVMKKSIFVGMIDVPDLYAEIQNLMLQTIQSERTLFANMMAEPYGIDTFNPFIQRIWP